MTGTYSCSIKIQKKRKKLIELSEFTYSVNHKNSIIIFAHALLLHYLHNVIEASQTMFVFY